MAIVDKRLRKPIFPNTSIGELLEQADKIKYNKIYNYEYTYYTKTPTGMRKDIPTCHQYGNDREGYEHWGIDNPDLRMSYAGVTTVREMYHIDKPEEILGYMFEKKLPNKPWIDEIVVLLDEAWQLFITEMDIKDTEAMEYYLFDGIIGDYRDSGQDLISKFNAMIRCIEKYNDTDEIEYKHFIDKIKG
jgi:hypothetical protein